MRFNEAVDELAANMGMPPVTPDDSGAFSLLFDDKFEVSFSPDRDDGSVVFHADLGDASNLDGDTARALLEASLLGAATGGAAFSIDPKANRVVIWRRHGEFSGCADLERALGSFLGLVVVWQERLGSGRFATADAADIADAPYSPFDGFIKV